MALGHQGAVVGVDALLPGYLYNMVQQQLGLVGLAGLVVEEGEELFLRELAGGFLLLTGGPGIGLGRDFVGLVVGPLTDLTHEVNDGPEQLGFIGMAFIIQVFSKILDGVKVDVEEFYGGIVIAAAGYNVLPAGLEGVLIKDGGDDFRGVTVTAEEVPDTGEGLIRLEAFGVKYLVGSLRELVDGGDYVFCVRVYHNGAKIPLFYSSLVMSLIISSSMSR